MISAVILAAGESKRMGGKLSKVLLPLNGDTVIEHIIKVLLRADVSEIIVVLGHNPKPIEQIVRKYAVKIVYNYYYEREMTSSFLIGLTAVSRLSDATFLVLGDQPLITTNLIRTMIEVYRKTFSLIISPIYKRKKGHPVLFDHTLYSEILSLGNHGIIRTIIHRYRDRMLTVPADEFAILDIDTQEDYERAKKLASNLLK